MLNEKQMEAVKIILTCNLEVCRKIHAKKNILAPDCKMVLEPGIGTQVADFCEAYANMKGAELALKVFEIIMGQENNMTKLIDYTVLKMEDPKWLKENLPQ